MEIAKGQVVRIKGRRGRIVHCLQGQIWLTQHGVYEDYFLPGGTSYRSVGDGLILVNSCEDISLVGVRDHASKAGIDVGPVRIESMQQLDRDARRARALSLTRISAGGRAALARWWERLRLLSSHRNSGSGRRPVASGRRRASGSSPVSTDGPG